jgi:hypothetical protein
MKPTRDELRLLRYLGLSESDAISVCSGNQGYEIEMTAENGESLGTVQTPYGKSADTLVPFAIPLARRMGFGFTRVS